MAGIATRKLGDAPLGGTAGEEMNDVVSGVVLPAKKRFLYKIYTSAGAFVTTWKDVLSEPKFSIALNGGFSELVVDLARLESNYDEGVSVKYGNQLKLYAFDGDNRYNGTLIFSGILSQYVPSVVGDKETVQVHFLSYWWQLDKMMLESAGNTTVTYSAQDPSNILKDLLDKFTVAGGKVDYGTGTVDLTGLSLTYAFNTATYQEALKKCLELSAVGWYLRIGADDLVYFKLKNSNADHTFTLGKNISEFTPEKRTENIINTIYFIGGGSPNYYKKYTDATSVATYGTRAVKYIDERVTTDAVSLIIANRILGQFKDPEVRVVIRVNDNNGDAFQRQQGYDIESVFVGQTCQIKNATSKADTQWDDALFDVDVWDYAITNASALILQIMKVDYSPDSILLELSNKQPDISKKIDDINRAFVDSITRDNPVAPA